MMAENIVSLVPGHTFGTSQRGTEAVVLVGSNGPVLPGGDTYAGIESMNPSISRTILINVVNGHLLYNFLGFLVFGEQHRHRSVNEPKPLIRELGCGYLVAIFVLFSAGLLEQLDGVTRPSDSYCIRVRERTARQRKQQDYSARQQGRKKGGNVPDEDLRL